MQIDLTGLLGLLRLSGLRRNNCTIIPATQSPPTDAARTALRAGGIVRKTKCIFLTTLRLIDSTRKETYSRHKIPLAYSAAAGGVEEAWCTIRQTHRSGSSSVADNQRRPIAER